MAKATARHILVSTEEKCNELKTQIVEGGADFAAVAKAKGWGSVPPGTRQSTYANPEYQKAAPYASFVLSSMNTVDPMHPTSKPVPYTGVQYVGIPEFQAIGTQVGQSISGALAGKMSVDEALAASQEAAKKAVEQGGYLK